MWKVTEISTMQDHRPVELRHLRIAAYYQVNTNLEEQTSSIELQERHYKQLISANPNWENTDYLPNELNSKTAICFNPLMTFLQGSVAALGNYRHTLLSRNG